MHATRPSSSSASHSATSGASPSPYSSSAPASFGHDHGGRATAQSEALPGRVAPRHPASSPLLPLPIDPDAQRQEDDARQLLEQAGKKARELLASLQKFNRSQFSLNEALDLFAFIKDASHALLLLSREGDEDSEAVLSSIGHGMQVCLDRFHRALTSSAPSAMGVDIKHAWTPTSSLLEMLSAEQVRQFCNGWSAITNDALRPSLFTRRQLDLMTPQLRELNDALVLQAMASGLPAELPSNGCLLDILNWQSRGLKAGVLEGSELVQALFGRALDIMQEWPCASGRVRSNAGMLGSRQSGKTMVQLNTIRQFRLLPLDESPAGRRYREALARLALALCSENALAESFSNPEISPPNGVELSNIGNTVKDFLEAGILRLDDEATRQAVQRLANLLVQTARQDLQQRGGQTLGNYCNLLRTVQECATRLRSPNDLLQAGWFHRACGFLLSCIASRQFWLGVDRDGKPGQTLANVASFLKAADKGSQDEMLRPAAAMLAVQLHGRGLHCVDDPRSLSALLSGLVVLERLAPPGSMARLVEELLVRLAAEAGPDWPARSRSLSLRAALDWQSGHTSPAAHDAIDRLLEAGHAPDDPLPYLKAVLLRSAGDPVRLAHFQPLLRALLPKLASTPAITQEDIQAAIARLDDGETALPRATLSPAQSNGPAPVSDRTLPRLAGETWRSPSSLPASPAAALHVASSKPKADKQQDKDDWKKPRKVAHPGKPAVAASPLSSSDGAAATPGKPAVQAAKAEAKAATAAELHTSGQAGASTTSSAPASAPPSLKANRAGRQAKGRKKPAAGSSTASSSPAGGKALGALEKEWFKVISAKGKADRIQRLESLLARQPALAGSRDSKGHSSLLHALCRGDPALVKLLMPHLPDMQNRQAVCSLLNALFEPRLVDKTMIAALDVFMKALEPSLAREVAHVLVGSSEVPRAYEESLRAWLNPPAPKAGKQEDTNHRADTLHGVQLAERPTVMSEKLRKQLETSVQRARNRNPLLAAAYYGQLAEVDALLRRPNAELMMMTGEPALGATALHIAIMRDFTDVAARLLQSPLGPDLAMITDNGLDTPLMKAVAYHRLDIMRMLLALPNAVLQTEFHSYPLPSNAIFIATSFRLHQAARLLAAVPGADKQMLQASSLSPTPLLLAVDDNNEELVRLFISLPSAAAQFEVISRNGANALFAATANGNAAIARLLLEHPDADRLVAPSPAMNGMNPLHQAVLADDPTLVQCFLQSRHAQTLCSQATFHGQTPLMAAIRSMHSRIVSLLLAHSSGPLQAMSVDADGATPLQIAVVEGQADVVRALLSLPNAREQALRRHAPVDGRPPLPITGMTAFEIAFRVGHAEIATLLSEFEDA